MGMFGRTLGRHESGHASMPKGGATVTIPATAHKTPARRGAFGRGWLTPERLQIIGATLQQLDGQQGAIADVIANQQQDTLEQRQAKEDAAQQQALAAALSTIDDPQLRRLAMMYPEQYARQLFSRTGSPTDGGWQSGQGYSHLWRPTPDGHVQLGDPLPLRPRQGSVPYGADTDEEGWIYD